MKMTRWFPGTVKPVRRGWYECAPPGRAFLQMDWWTGRKWKTGPGGMVYTEEEQTAFIWRGVAK